VAWHFLQLRWRVSPFRVIPIRVFTPHDGQSNITLDTARGAGNMTFWPFSPRPRARKCLTRTFNPSTTTNPSRGKHCKTFPDLPLSLPCNTITLSSLRIFIEIQVSQYFRSKRHDLNKPARSQFSCHRTEDARTLRFLGLKIDNHSRVLVKT